MLQCWAKLLTMTKGRKRRFTNTPLRSIMHYPVIDPWNFFVDENEEYQHPVVAGGAASLSSCQHQQSQLIGYKQQQSIPVAASGSFHLLREAHITQGTFFFVTACIHIHLFPEVMHDTPATANSPQMLSQPINLWPALCGDASQAKQGLGPKPWRTFTLMTANKAFFFLGFYKNANNVIGTLVAAHSRPT